MPLQQELSRYGAAVPTVCTLGVFDGVHLGHQALVARAVEIARAHGYRSAVVVFHPHPQEVLRPGTSVPLLTTLEQRTALLLDLGVDTVARVTFDRELASLSARHFMEIMVRDFGLRGLVAGPDFALGRGREGTITVLTELGRELGYEVSVISALEADTRKVSSTTIRHALEEGDVAGAATLLGRPHATSGVVEHGAGRGTVLGFPTANLPVDPRLALPADGIYATWVRTPGGVFPSATYVGSQPTFSGTRRVIEVFLLDFSGNLYDAEITIDWIAQVRPDQRFDSIDALKAQMDRDVAQARVLLAESPARPSTGRGKSERS